LFFAPYKYEQYKKAGPILRAHFVALFPFSNIILSIDQSTLTLPNNEVLIAKEIRVHLEFFNL